VRGWTDIFWTAEMLNMNRKVKYPEAATAPVKDMMRFRESSTPQMKRHFQGVVQTIWSGPGGFLDQFYGRKPANDQKNPGHTEANCFKRMFEEIANHK
jgi:hypothetical protein